MDVHSFLTRNQIAVCVVLERSSKRYLLFRNETESLDSLTLFRQLVFGTAFDDLCGYLDGQELLPRMLGQGNVQCIMFPNQDQDVVCLFFCDDSDAVTLFRRCTQMMQDYLAES